MNLHLEMGPRRRDDAAYIFHTYRKQVGRHFLRKGTAWRAEIKTTALSPAHVNVVIFGPKTLYCGYFLLRCNQKKHIIVKNYQYMHSCDCEHLTTSGCERVVINRTRARLTLRKSIPCSTCLT